MGRKVIIADDEVMICEGIARVIPWEKLGLELVKTVYDGKMLEEALLESEPDIVITDIEMPYQNGIEVIRKFADAGRMTQYIIVSAYNEFEYAQTAMAYGVREYLLKPISRDDLVGALTNCMKRIREEQGKRQLYGMIKANESVVVSALRMEMLRDLLLGFGHRDEAAYQYCGMERMEGQECRLVVLMSEQDDSEIYNPIAFKELGELFLAGAHVLYSTIVEDMCVLIVDELDVGKLSRLTREFKEKYKQIYAGDAFVVISNICKVGDVRDEFLKSAEICKNSVEYGSGETVVAGVGNGAAVADRNKLHLERYDDVVMDIRLKNEEQVASKVHELLEKMQALSWSKDSIRLTCMEFGLRIYSKCSASPGRDMTAFIQRIQGAANLWELEEKLIRFFLEIPAGEAGAEQVKTEPIVEKIKEIVEAEYMDTDLSIRKMATTRLYLSPDYIGRIFKKKMSMSITRYITLVRLEKAKAMLRQGDKKVFEVALQCGFGYNSQYFSQIFKKFTGVLPSEYENARD